MKVGQVAAVPFHDFGEEFRHLEDSAFLCNCDNCVAECTQSSEPREEFKTISGAAHSNWLP